MALVEYKNFEGVGSGFTVRTQAIPPAGLLPVLRAARQGSYNVFRYSTDGGGSWTSWLPFSLANRNQMGRLTDRCELVVDYVTEPLTESGDPYDEPIVTTVYDKTMFKSFFNSNDPRVFSWSVNVLEKLFEPGIIPLYITRDNQDDYNTLFFAITQFFAFIVIYARYYREFESSEVLMREFIEGWGLVYENVNLLEQRRYLFLNWINEFKNRGRAAIADTGGTIDGELRRLVGYIKPSEFIFAIFAPQNTGWCLGWSSPTWRGTWTVDAVCKGYDYGIDYVGDESEQLIAFGQESVQIGQAGGAANNTIITDLAWRIGVGGTIAGDIVNPRSVGVGPLTNYPIIGDVRREFMDNMFVLHPSGAGRAGISTEEDTSKVVEVYFGLDYEITVWVKAASVGLQNIEFGVKCYDGDMQLINQVRLTDLRQSNSFFTGDRYQNPCKVPGVYYRLRGVIYNINESMPEDGDERLYLNFENGRPLRFGGEVKYMAPYIVQDRSVPVADIYIAGVTIKPLNLPFTQVSEKELADNGAGRRKIELVGTQGWLGQKNIIGLYSTINSARTKKDIEDFIERYLIGWKNTIAFRWLDYVVRNSFFLTFWVVTDLGVGIADAVVTVGIGVGDGFTVITDSEGYARLEVAKSDLPYQYSVESGGTTTTGTVLVQRDTDVQVVIE